MFTKSTKKTDDSVLISNIVNDKGITQQALAEQLGVSKQFISQVANGVRSFGNRKREELRRLYPAYFATSSYDLPVDIAKEDLLKLRKHYKLSQERIASVLGISQSLYAKLETGERKITVEIAERIRTYNANPNIPRLNTKPTRLLDVLDIMYCPDTKLPLHSKIIPTNSYFALDRKALPDDIDINPFKCRFITLSDSSLAPEYKRGDKCLIDTSRKAFVNDYVFAFVVNNQCYIRLIQILPDKIKCISVNENKDTFYLSDVKDVVVLGLIVPKIRL